jgi:hypothetical protein
MVFVALSTGEADLPSRLALSFPGKLADAQAKAPSGERSCPPLRLWWLERFCMHPCSREISALVRTIFK